MGQHEVYFLGSDEGQQTDSDMWQAHTNPDLDVPERVRRRIETHEEAIKYNWPIWRGEQRLSGVKLIIEKYQRLLENQTENLGKQKTENLNFFE